MAFCINCGTAYKEGQKYCTRCGNPLPVIRSASQAAAEKEKAVQPAVSEAQGTVQPSTKDPSEKSNGMCTAGLVLSILGIFLLGITSIFGLIFSIAGLKSAKKKGQKGSKKAVAGIVLSLLTLVLIAGVLIVEREPIMDTYEKLTGRTFPTRRVSADYDDMIQGSAWVVREDETCIQLTKKGHTFNSYLSYLETSDMYLTGKYELYNGKKAVEYLTKNAGDACLSEEAIEEITDPDNGYDVANLFALVCSFESFVYNGDTQQLDKETRQYYGFYVLIDAGEQVFDAIEMVNLNADTSFTLIREDQYDEYISAVLSEMGAQ